MRNRVGLLMLLLLLVACSGLPKPLQPDAKVNADNMLEYARRLENKGSDAALDTYGTALQRYRAFAGVEGELWCLAGTARIRSAQGDSLSVQATLDSMDGIVRDIDPGLEYIPLLTRLQVLAGRNAWSAMLPLAKVESTYPILARMQIISFGVQASAYLDKPDIAMATELQSLYNKTQKKAYKKGSEQALGVAHAAYSLACHYYVSQDQSRAEELVTYAAEMDYLYGNFRGLGYDLWLTGRILCARSDFVQARAAFMKAERIFSELQDAAMLQAIQTEIAATHKGDGR